MRRPVAAALLVSILGLGAPVAAQSGSDKEEQIAFNNTCRTCHTLKAGDNRLGPNLDKVIGRKAGSLPDYDYSPAMKNAGLTWDKATLDRFIADPEAVVPGNKMKPYGGLASPEERARIIAFLEAAAD